MKKYHHPLCKLTSKAEIPDFSRFSIACNSEVLFVYSYEINVIKKAFEKMKSGLQSFAKFLDHKVVLQMLKLGELKQCKTILRSAFASKETNDE